MGQQGETCCPIFILTILTKVSQPNMDRKPQIGDVTIFKGMPENGNPFRRSNNSVIGQERVRTFKQWIKFGQVEGYTFWNTANGMPLSGRQINGPEGVDWSTADLDNYDDVGQRIR